MNIKFFVVIFLSASLLWPCGVSANKKDELRKELLERMIWAVRGVCMKNKKSRKKHAEIIKLDQYEELASQAVEILMKDVDEDGRGKYLETCLTKTQVFMDIKKEGCNNVGVFFEYRHSKGRVTPTGGCGVSGNVDTEYGINLINNTGKPFAKFKY